MRCRFARRSAFAYDRWLGVADPLVRQPVAATTIAPWPCCLADRLTSSPLSPTFMSKKRKRISRRRLAGQRVLAHVPTFNLETGSHKPVTAARRYIAEQALVPPAILNVRRNEHTTDRFFWGEKGLFSAQYAEENHFLFPSLRLIVDRIGEDVLFEGLEALAADDWEEMEEYEYAFV